LPLAGPVVCLAGGPGEGPPVVPLRGCVVAPALRGPDVQVGDGEATEVRAASGASTAPALPVPTGSWAPPEAHGGCWHEGLAPGLAGVVDAELVAPGVAELAGAVDPVSGGAVETPVPPEEGLDDSGLDDSGLEDSAFDDSGLDDSVSGEVPLSLAKGDTGVSVVSVAVEGGHVAQVGMPIGSEELSVAVAPLSVELSSVGELAVSDGLAVSVVWVSGVSEVLGLSVGVRLGSSDLVGPSVGGVSLGCVGDVSSVGVLVGCSVGVSLGEGVDVVGQVGSVPPPPPGGFAGHDGGACPSSSAITYERPCASWNADPTGRSLPTLIGFCPPLRTSSTPGVPTYLHTNTLR
jgi:hypothetical protein